MKKLPFGLDPLYDVKHILRGYEIKTIIDAGANVGQSAIVFANFFPSATIHSIEPISATFQVLQERTSGYPAINCYNLALGENNSQKKFKVWNSEKSTRASLKSTNQVNKKDYVFQFITISTLTVFCAEFGVERVNYLKIDTEGYELRVLKGACDLLNNQAIDLIQVEAGMNCRNKYHVNFTAIVRYLEKRDYSLFGIYDQTQEWILNKPILRRSNLLFISRELAWKINNHNGRFNRVDKFEIQDSAS